MFSVLIWDSDVVYGGGAAEISCALAVSRKRQCWLDALRAQGGRPWGRHPVPAFPFLNHTHFSAQAFPVTVPLTGMIRLHSLHCFAAIAQSVKIHFAGTSLLNSAATWSIYDQLKVDKIACPQTLRWLFRVCVLVADHCQPALSAKCA